MRFLAVSVEHSVVNKEMERGSSAVFKICIFIHFPVVPKFDHRAPFGVSVITHTRHTVGLLWTSDQPVAETSTYTQHNI
jgi:hypothetical protein